MTLDLDKANEPERVLFWVRGSIALVILDGCAHVFCLYRGIRNRIA